MVKQLEKLTKIRSFDEILTRGGQALAVYREQRRKNELLSDSELFRLIDTSQFGSSPIIAETLWQRFFRNGDERFFPSFKNPVKSAKFYSETCGQESIDHFVGSADKITSGRIDLLGLINLYVGTDIDWHSEPVSAKRSPLKHWKQFDDLDTTETGNKKIVWELNRHQHFFTLGVAYWLTGDERYAKTFVRQLESWMGQNPPGIGINWSSSLEVAFRSMSWIWASHFFKGSEFFTPEIFKNALKFLYHHGRHIEQYLSKYYSPNTHLTGEALGLYYLGTQLPFFARAKHWRKLGEDILFAEITKQILPDGVYFEQSTWYQRYSVDIYSQFIVLRTLFGEPYYTGAASNLENRLQKAFDMMMAVTMPNGCTPIIGDDDGGRLLPLTIAGSDDFRGSLAIGATIFGRGDYKFVAGSGGHEIFWLFGEDGIASYERVKAVQPETTSLAFADGGYYVMRDGWSETDNYLTVDCGEVGSLSGGHGHADALSIEIAMHGRTLLVDSGTYTYHESKELRDYFRSTTAHNTLVIDGVSSSEPAGTFAWNERAEAKKHSWISEVRFDFFEGSHDGYRRLADPATHTRSILYIKNDYWIMRDLVETSGSHKYSLNFHFNEGLRSEIGNEGKWIGGEDHRLFTFGDNGEWQQKESWISKNHGNKTNAPFFRFNSGGTGPQEFFTFILPVERGVEPPEVVEVPNPAGRAFTIKYNGYTDIFVLNDSVGDIIDTGFFESNFRYTWARLSEGESLPDEFVLIGGDKFKIDGKDLYDTHEGNYLSARRLGNEIYMKTDLGRSKKTL